MGFSLLEVLISMVLLSLMLLGLDAMEIHSLRSTQDAYDIHLENHQRISMNERLHITGISA
jgi:prepilin-type N-terminal cleavage/methylation domain-containing protein